MAKQSQGAFYEEFLFTNNTFDARYNEYFNDPLSKNMLNSLLMSTLGLTPT
jgi:hypothetical protein